MITKILLIILFSFLAGWCYRAGGAANMHARWLRQLGVGVSVTGGLIALFGFHWWILACLGTSWAESTYFKKKGTDAQLINWMAVGLVFALVPLPFIISSGSYWFGFVIRSVFVVSTTTLIGELVGDVQWSEGLRGALQVVSLPLLLIGA